MQSEDDVKVLNKICNEIVEDLKICIQYEPNKENDLCCLFERYLNELDEENSNCEYILEQIKACIDGENYDNPFKIYYYYNEEHIQRVKSILDTFINSIGRNKNLKYLENSLKFFLLQLNEINLDCDKKLIDQFRKEKIEEIVVIIKEKFDVKVGDNLWI